MASRLNETHTSSLSTRSIRSGIAKPSGMGESVGPPATRLPSSPSLLRLPSSSPSFPLWPTCTASSPIIYSFYQPPPLHLANPYLCLLACLKVPPHSPSPPVRSHPCFWNTFFLQILLSTFLKTDPIPPLRVFSQSTLGYGRWPAVSEKSHQLILFNQLISAMCTQVKNTKNTNKCKLRLLSALWRCHLITSVLITRHKLTLQWNGQLILFRISLGISGQNAITLIILM